MSARWVRDREKERDQGWMGSGSVWSGAFRLTGGMLAVPTDGNGREIGFENRTGSHRRLSVRVSAQVEIHLTGRRREELFLPPDCNGTFKDRVQ